MKKRIKRSLSLALTSLLIFSSVSLGAAPVVPRPVVDLNFFIDVFNTVERKYPFELNREELMEKAINGMLSGVDQYSGYYSPEEASELFDLIDGEFYGIGVEIGVNDQGQVEVKRLMEGHPAQRAGMKVGDVILSIEDIDLKDGNVGKASHYIRGRKDTSVFMKILRDGKILDLNIKREKIELKKTSSEILEGDIGYIRLEEFNPVATEEFNKILEDFDGKNLKKIILDLRNNPGGTLIDAIKISEKFVEKGPIVHIRERGRSLKTYTSELEKTKYELVVLVNENSASASEIVAGAVKDRKAGVLVGNLTFGKGTVQSVMPLTNGGIIKLTVAEYLTPNMISINKKGIEPDHKIFNYGERDLQLEKAVEILRKN